MSDKKKIVERMNALVSEYGIGGALNNGTLQKAGRDLREGMPPSDPDKAIDSLRRSLDKLEKAEEESND